jgi:hypothetical protein
MFAFEVLHPHEIFEGFFELFLVERPATILVCTLE